MSIKEIHYEVKLKSNKVDSQYRRDLTPLEIDTILNDQINMFVDINYPGFNPRKEAFETSQNVTDKLSTLVVKQPFGVSIAPSKDADNVYEFKLSSSSNYRHLIRGSFEVKQSDCTKKVSADFHQHDDLDFVLSDPFKKPNFKWGRVVAVFGEDSDVSGDQSVYGYADSSFEITAFLPEYLRHPVKVSIGGYNDVDGNPVTLQELDLPEHTHRMIVDMTVAEIQRILKDAESYQLFAEKIKSNN